MEFDLSGLVGTFRGTDRIHASAWGEQEDAAATASGSVELGAGLVVRRHEVSRANGPFVAVDVFMPDPVTGEVLLYSFDSAGFPPEPPARGQWREGVLVLDRTTERGESRTTYRPTDDGYAWSKEYRPEADSPWQSVVTGELQRRPDAAG